MSSSIGIAGPVWAAIGVIAVAAGGAYAGGTSLVLPQGVLSVPLKVIEPRTFNVRARQATVDRVLTSAGQRVTAGEIIVQIDSSGIDREIAAMREQSAGVQRQLEAVKVEAQAFGILHDQQLASREKVTELESRLAGLERSSSELMSAIRGAEGRLARAVVRAPVSGTVIAVAVAAEGRPFQAGEIIVTITPDPDRIVLEGELPPAVANALREPSEVRAWLGASSLLLAQPLRARLTWLSHQDDTVFGAVTDTGSDQDFGRSDRPVRGLLELDQPRSALAGGVRLAPGDAVNVFARDAGSTLPDMLAHAWHRTFRLPLSLRVTGE